MSNQNKTYKKATLNSSTILVDNCVRLKRCVGTGTVFNTNSTNYALGTELHIEHTELNNVKFEGIGTLPFLVQHTKISKSKITEGSAAQYSSQYDFVIDSSRIKKMKFGNLQTRRLIISNSILENVGFKDLNVERILMENHPILVKCNFKNTNLRSIDLLLGETRFIDCNFEGTCLDPQAPVPAVADDLLTKYGYSFDSEYIYGYMTSLPTYYMPFCDAKGMKLPHAMPGTTIFAPMFSISTENTWHPGINISAAPETAGANKDNQQVVKVKVKRTNMVTAADSKFRVFRCKELEIVEVASYYKWEEKK